MGLQDSFKKSILKTFNLKPGELKICNIDFEKITVKIKYSLIIEYNRVDHIKIAKYRLGEVLETLKTLVGVNKLSLKSALAKSDLNITWGTILHPKITKNNKLKICKGTSDAMVKITPLNFYLENLMIRPIVVHLSTLKMYINKNKKRMWKR